MKPFNELESRIYSIADGVLSKFPIPSDSEQAEVLQYAVTLAVAKGYDAGLKHAYDSMVASVKRALPENEKGWGKLYE